VDGFISTAGALIAHALAPSAADYMILAHRSAEPGHRIMHRRLGKEPLLDLGMRLGEGTGGALAMNLVEAAVQIARHAWDVLARVLSLDRLATLPFWAFLYLVLCIGSHLAPSPADYKGAWSGGLLLLGLLLLFNVLHLAVGGQPGMVTGVLAATLGPVLGLLVLAAVLSALTAPAVFAVTGAFRKRG
jgi:hypothetical protein